MIRTIAFVVFTLVLALIPRTGTTAQSSPAVFPLTTGTYWIYEGTSRIQGGGDDVSEEHGSCRMEITRTIQHGATTIAVVEGYPDGPDEAVPDSDRGGYLIVKTATNDYFFVGTVTVDQVIEASDDPARLSELLLKEAFLVLDLPLTPGKTFAPMEPDIERDDTYYAWHIDGRRRARLTGVRGLSRSRVVTKYEIAFRTLPDHTIIELVPGIGIARYVYSHHGTVDDVDMRLVEYHRAVGAPQS